MILEYTANQPSQCLQSDLAGEFPLYLYWPSDKSILLYSTSITELLTDARVSKPLKVSEKGLSFLLQSGVVPPPTTAYEDVYLIGIGDKAQITTVKGRIEVTFSHEFPFLNSNRPRDCDMTPDEDLILQLLAEATLSRIDESRPSFLFHSAGKDSNSIALALAEAGWQDKVTLITHQSKGRDDESVISAAIAKRLGFRHHTLHEVDQLESRHKEAIESYFVNVPFPSTDHVTLAYPLYTLQVPELRGANIIDGLGNDVFLGHIPSRLEYNLQKLSGYLKYGRFCSNQLRSESLFHVLGRSRAEVTGMYGMSLADTKRILNDPIDVSNYWLERDTSQDYIDFRSSIRGAIIDPEIFVRKARNFTDSINANLVLPWANERVAGYFSQFNEIHLFNRKKLKNKLIIRRLLKNRNVIDSDKLGKMTYRYDSHSLIIGNWEAILDEIYQCVRWNRSGLEMVIPRMRRVMNGSGFRARQSGRLVYRIYLCSSWLNKNKYLN